MKQLQNIIAASLFLFSLTAAAQQDKGSWRAASTTARSITGDVLLSEEKLSIDFVNFPMSRVRTLQASEVSAVFDADTTAAGTGSLYRITISSSKKFLHHNSLCGSDDTQWMVTYVTGRSLQVAFFSSQKPPSSPSTPSPTPPTSAAPSPTPSKAVLL